LEEKAQDQTYDTGRGIKRKAPRLYLAAFAGQRIKGELGRTCLRDKEIRQTPTRRSLERERGF